MGGLPFNGEGDCYVAFLEIVSSNIRFVEYNKNKLQLMVAFEEPDEDFNFCRIYSYKDVPESIYEAFMSFPSKGEFLCEHIAFKFEYEFLGLGESCKP
jgi:hypothetical protein